MSEPTDKGKLTPKQAARVARADKVYPHENAIGPLWDQAALSPGAEIDIGRLVACDDCGTDYTDLPESGGYVWHNRATCPPCADRVLKVLPSQKLLRLMQTGMHCPEGISFADFVRSIRTTTIIKINPPPKPRDAK